MSSDKNYSYQMIKWPGSFSQSVHGFIIFNIFCYYFHIFSVFNRLNSNFSLSFQVLMKF